MFKEYKDIVVSRSYIYRRKIAERAIQVLNSFVDKENQYSLSDIESLIEKYANEPQVLVKMMDLKQIFRNVAENSYFQKLPRIAVEALLIKDYSKDILPQVYLAHVLGIVTYGENAEKVLTEKVDSYQIVSYHRKSVKENNTEQYLLRAIAEKAKKTLDYLSQKEYKIEEIINLIDCYFSDEKDLYRLLNFHEAYGAANVQACHNELLKDAIFCLLKGQIGLDEALSFSQTNAGRDAHKALSRLVGNLKRKEDQRHELIKIINRCDDIKELKNVVSIYKDNELMQLFERYKLLVLARSKYPEYFKKVENQKEKSVGKASAQVTLRRIFAEVLVNKIYDLEELAYFVIGHRDKETFLRNLANYEILTQFYEISFEQFMKIKNDRLSSGRKLIEVMQDAILSPAFNSHRIEDKDFAKYNKKYNLEKLIMDIKYNLDRDNIDFNIKDNDEIVEIISSALDRYGPDIDLIEQMIGGEIRKNKTQILDLIVGDVSLTEKYEQLEQERKLSKLAVEVRKLDIEELEIILLEERRSTQEIELIRNELNTKLSLGRELLLEKQQKEKKQNSALRKAFDKLGPVLSVTFQNKVVQLLEEQQIEGLKELVRQQGLAVKAKLYINYVKGNKFLKLLELDNEIFAELKECYIPADGQFTRGHMDKIKNVWGLTASEVHSLGDIIGNSGRKARK